VMLDDAPPQFISELLPHHKALCVRGRHLRAMLPVHQKRQGLSIAAHCPLPTVLKSVVSAYALTGPEDMWTTGLYPRSQERLAEHHYFLRSSQGATAKRKRAHDNARLLGFVV
jgi:hypothetical protein